MASTDGTDSTAQVLTAAAAAAEATTDDIRPFEWLTSPASLACLIEEYVLRRIRPRRQRRNANSDGSASHPFQLQALHVGCGSSTVGEFLIETLGFSKVVNVDCDEETMQRMEERWNNKVCRTIPESSHRIADDRLLPQQEQSRMEFVTLDFTKDHLPETYNNMFDLILDKSTLDCTLCSDTATAALLVECYRTLRADNGVYMVISFHELDLLLPLLQELPGAQWNVTHSTMERQVEDILASTDNVATPAKDMTKPATKAVSNHDIKPLNVLIARRYNNNDDDHDDDVSSTLDFDSVYQHVHRVNDRWFQKQQPLLTKERIEELRQAFGGVPTTTMESATHDKSKKYSLEEAFPLLFTDAEREHLTFEHFMEDWAAFVETKQGGLGDDKTITFEVAIDFLREMQ